MPSSMQWLLMGELVSMRSVGFRMESHFALAGTIRRCWSGAFRANLFLGLLIDGGPSK